MNRAKGIGPAARISSAMRATRPGSLGGSGASGSSSGHPPQAEHDRPPRGRGIRRRHRRCPSSEAHARPDQRVAAEQHRDRRISRRGSERRAATDREPDRRAGGRTRSGPRAAARRPRRRRADAPAARACRRPRASPSSASTDPRASGPRSSSTRPRTERGGRAASRQRGEPDRPQPALLDQCPRPRRGVPLQPAQGGGARAAGDDELGSAIRRDRAKRGRPAGSPPRHRRPRPDPRRPPRAARRSASRSRSTAAIAGGGRRPRSPADLLQPARQRVVARQVRHGGERGRSPTAITSAE